MSVSTEEAVIIGCIVGIAVLIVFGLLLWYICSKKTPKIRDTNYDQLPQNEQEKVDIESAKDTKINVESEPMLSADIGKSQSNVTPKVLISVQNSINNDKNEAICDYQVECKKEEDDDASHLDVVNGLLSKSKTVSVESMDEEKTTINAAKTVGNTKAANDGSVEHKLEETEKNAVKTNENDKKEDIMDKAAIIDEPNEEKEDIVKAEDDEKKEEKVEKDVVVNDRKHDDEETKGDDEEMDADKTEKDAVNDRKEEEDKKQDVEDIESDTAKIHIVDDKKEENKDIEAIQRTDDVDDGDKEQDDAYDHDIEDENEDIIKPLDDHKTKQQQSTLSTATSSSILSVDSNANVFGNRWNDSQRGFEWNEEDNPMETDDNTENVDKIKDVTIENN